MLEYKEGQIIRKIESFMKQKSIGGFFELAGIVKRDTEFANELKNFITINVTEFFRNVRFWDTFKDEIVPSVLKYKKTNRRLRIWSAACSTGEEPYTIAMILKDNFVNIPFEIIATDLDDEVLEEAREGTYDKRSLISLNQQILRKHFKDVDKNKLSINNELKKHITFKSHNLLNDPYPTNLDIIVCRNVLIYFTDEAKKGVYKGFSKSLRNKGVLFVGASEQIIDPKTYDFKLIKPFFYQKET